MIYRFIAYGGCRFNTDKVVGLLMNTHLKGLEDLVRGCIVKQTLPAMVTERRWFGLQGKSLSGVLIDELKNGNVELSYPNDFGGYMDAFIIFFMLMTYEQLGVDVKIFDDKSVVSDDLLKAEAADVERQMADTLRSQMLEKYECAMAGNEVSVPGFHCPLFLTKFFLTESFANKSQDEALQSLFDRMIDLQWNYSDVRQNGADESYVQLDNTSAYLVNTQSLKNIYVRDDKVLKQISIAQFAEAVSKVEAFSRIDAYRYAMIVVPQEVWSDFVRSLDGEVISLG